MKKAPVPPGLFFAPNFNSVVIEHNEGKISKLG